jgi:hypothetical protein
MADGDGLQLEDGRWLKVQGCCRVDCGSQTQRSPSTRAPCVASGKPSPAD